MTTDRAALFRRGHFRLHSGAYSVWKVECDALTADDWIGLAAMALVQPAGDYIGIPRGGLLFAAALRKVYGISRGAVPLIVDDVWTTGASMTEALAKHPDASGLVAFARTPIDNPRVRAVWTCGK